MVASQWKDRREGRRPLSSVRIFRVILSTLLTTQLQSQPFWTISLVVLFQTDGPDQAAQGSFDVGWVI